MDKLKKIFSGGSEKEAHEAESSARSHGEHNLESEALSAGSGTGVTGSSGHGASSYAREAEQDLTSSRGAGASSATQDINRPFARDDPTSTSSSGLMGSSDTAGYTSTSGRLPQSDVSTTASVKSGVQGTDLSGVSESDRYTAQPSSTQYSGMGTSSGAGLTGTALPDRSVGATGSTGNYSSAGTYDEEIPRTEGPHKTFTGNRLDPAFTESIPTYHEEVAEEHKHRPTGTAALGATGMAATYTISGADAEQYKTASSISTVGYGSQSYGGTTSSMSGSGYSGQNYGASSSLYGQGDVTGPASNTIGPHDSNLANIADPRVQPEPSMMRGNQSSGRDAGLAAGVGAAAYESEKPAAVRRYEEDTGTFETPRAHHGTGATAGAAQDMSQYPARADLEHHEEMEDRDRKQTKGGMLGFLHSSQKDKYDDPQERDTSAREKYFGQHRSSHADADEAAAATSSHHHGREAAALGTVGVLGTGAAYEYEQARGPTMTTATTTGAGYYDPNATEATTGPTGFAVGYTGDSAGRTTIPATTHHHTAPVVAAPVVVEAVPEKKHHFGFLHRKDPNKLHKEPPATSPDATGDGRVIDSVTGLPMNVAKYGLGTGGTDGQRSIHGYDKAVNSERLVQEGTADYKAIGKANVPY